MQTHSKLSVRLLSPWNKLIETENAVFSADFSPEVADALLCEWQPNCELFTFPGPKAWYCCEPACQFPYLQNGTWNGYKKRIQNREFLNHCHSDPNYRIPHITHFGTLTVNSRGNRMEKAVAIVSNHGGSPWSRHPEISLRNRLITHPLVDLFGRSGWKSYRKSLFSLPRLPENYCGELPGDWHAMQKRELQSCYKVSICLENMLEPYYFTEKFVEAVMAGCIPVYRAHATVRDSVLRGAFWIDPEEDDHVAKRTLERALDCSLSEVQAQNAEWLLNADLQKTCPDAVFSKIASILGAK